MNPLNFFRGLRLIGKNRAVKQEIDEELRCHIERRTAENIAAGMSPQEAERQARKRFGNLQSVRESCRDTRGASIGESTVQDIGFALPANVPIFAGVIMVVAIATLLAMWFPARRAARIDPMTALRCE